MTIIDSARQLAAEDLVGQAISTVGSDRGSPTKIPTYRYVSNDFAVREAAQLWPKVWQVAGSVDHVAEAGDYLEVNIGTLSAVVVRGEDGVLRAFQNVCRHRGNSLVEGAGASLTELRCPYHRWSWDLRGSLREVPSRRGFGVLRNDDLPLLPVQVSVWGRLVFVNFDLDAEPLEAWLEGVPDDIAWAGMESFRCTAMVTLPVDCNWKVVSDGFSETYHVQGIHPEMLGSMDDIDAPQRVWHRMTKSAQAYGVASPRLGRNVADQVIWDSFIVTQGARMGVDQPCPAPEVPAGLTIRDVIAQRIVERQRDRGVDLSMFDTDQLTRLHQYNLFPNATVLVTPDLLSVLIGRPGVDADHAEMVMVVFERAEAASGGRSTPMNVTLPRGTVGFGTVLNQDVGQMHRVQRGLHQPGFTHMHLSSEEVRIITMHRTLEEFLGITPSELSGGPA